jgi:hypothetical protein
MTAVEAMAGRMIIHLPLLPTILMRAVMKVHRVMAILVAVVMQLLKLINRVRLAVILLILLR